MPSEHYSEQPTPARLEAFSDGVIAVIITIMVLDFKLPSRSGPVAFFEAFLPTLTVYFVSFAFTGVYWINHHYLVHRLKFVDSHVLFANLLLLFCLSLLPFTTSYAVHEKLDSFSVAAYACELFVCGIAFLLLSSMVTRHLLRKAAHVDPKVLSIQHTVLTKSYLSLFLYASAIPLAYWHPYVAAADLALVTFLWVVQGFSTRPDEK